MLRGPAGEEGPEALRFTLENSLGDLGRIGHRTRIRGATRREGDLQEMRPGDPPTKDAAESLFQNMFLTRSGTLSRVGA